MCAITTQCHPCRIHGFDRAHRIAFDARNLHQTADRITGQTQVMFHANFSGIFDLCIGTTKRSGQTARRHRTCHTNLALTTDLSTRNRRIEFVQNPDRTCRKQKIHHTFIGCIRYKSLVIMQHRWHDAGSTIGRCGNDATTRRVFFIGRNRVQTDPIHHRERIGERALGVLRELLIKLSSTTFDI